MGTLGEEVTFSINEYDEDGDVVTEGIYLHFEDTRVLVAEGIDQYLGFLKRLNEMKDELIQAAKDKDL